MPSEAIACLRCQRTMTKVRLPSGVDVDCCDDHGVWLDRGELEQIVRHAESTRSSSHSGPSILGQVGATFVDSAVRGAGWSLSSNLVRRIFG